MWRTLGALAPLARGTLLAALFGAAFAALLYAVRRSSAPPGPPIQSRAGILVVAALLRLLALPLAPALSGDVHRYLWDGRVLLAGENPYRLAPGDAELAALRAAAGEAAWRRIEHPEVPTVYPPLALGLFALAAATPAPLLFWKLLVAAADLAGCAALLALARRLGLPAIRTVGYAWNPLVVIETAGMGHVDALGVAAAVAAVLWVVRARGAAASERAGDSIAEPATESPAESAATRRPAGVRWAAGAGAAAAAGALAKLAPLVALPMWARQGRRPWVLLGAAALLLAAGLAPVVAAAGGVPPGLLAYGVSWEFDGPLYEPAWRLLDAADADLRVKALFDRVEERTGRWHLMDPVYPYVYPRLLARAALALLLLAAVARSALSSRWLADPVAGTGKLFTAALLASATVYPWYLLWVLPWAALGRQRTWLLASASAPLAYLVAPVGPVTGGPFPWLWLAVWGPPALAALALPDFRRWSTG